MNLFKRKINPFYKFSLKYHHRLGVSTALISNDNILLIRRENEPYKNKWCFPGGKIEEGEHYIDATIREIKEETGFSIILPEIHLLKILYCGDYILFVSISQIYDSTYKFNKNQFIHDKITSKWFNLEEISQIDNNEIAPGIKELIPIAFKLLKLNYVNI